MFHFTNWHFAGIWTTLNGDRGTKSKPIPGPHQVYGFLTTSPNGVVEPIHPKAMPVILTTDEERDVLECARPGMKRRRYNGPCPTKRSRSSGVVRTRKMWSVSHDLRRQPSIKGYWPGRGV
jgi:putative SOS response-associated peptidase YedK